MDVEWIHQARERRRSKSGWTFDGAAHSFISSLEGHPGFPS
jgi:hypothetical protein